MFYCVCVNLMNIAVYTRRLLYFDLQRLKIALTFEGPYFLSEIELYKDLYALQVIMCVSHNTNIVLA